MCVVSLAALAHGNPIDTCVAVSTVLVVRVCVSHCVECVCLSLASPVASVGAALELARSCSVTRVCGASDGSRSSSRAKLLYLISIIFKYIHRAAIAAFNL